MMNEPSTNGDRSTNEGASSCPAPASEQGLQNGQAPPGRFRTPLGEHLTFWGQLRGRYRSIGAVAPSSRFLAKALTGPLRGRRGPVRVLEVGPGTGAVTRYIVGLLKPEDRLDMVELNERFAAILRQRFRDDPPFRICAEQSCVHQCPLEEYRSEQPYDYIISGLPLTSFPPETVRTVFEVCFGLMARGGVLSYFEYMLLRGLRRRVSGGHGRMVAEQRDRIIEEYLSGYRFRRDPVLINLPPAWVHHLRREE